MKPFAAVLTLCLTGAQLSLPDLHAERKAYVPDRAHCQLNFIGDALFVSAHGYFERWDSDFQMDPGNLENSSLAITIESASLNTRVTQRDNHLRSADFLDVANHPQIKFVSS